MSVSPELLLSPRVLEGLDDLATAAARTLDSDLLLIVGTPERELGERAAILAGDGRPARLLAADGLGYEGLDGLEASLGELQAALDAGGGAAHCVPVLAGCEMATAKVLLSHGFAAALCAPVELDGERMATMFAFKREPGPFTKEALIATFASQAALAIGHARLRRSSASPIGSVRRLEALDELVLSAHNFEQLSVALNETIAPLLGVEKTGIMIWDERRELLQMVAGSFGASEETALSYQVSVFDTNSNSARVFTSGCAYISNQAHGDPGILQEFVEAFELQRLLSVPLTMAQRPIGVLHIANKHADFGVEDLQRVEVLGARIAGVVELARTLFRLRRQQRLEEILSSVAVAVASGRGLRDFLAGAMRELGEAIEASYLALVHDGGPPVQWRCGSEPSPQEEIVLRDAREGPGVRAYVLGPQKAGDPGWAAFYTPVILGGQRAGTLAALRTHGEPFAQDERRALGRLASLAALSSATERYQQQRAELARLQERQRIADDLHDDVAQILFAAQLNLDAILESGQVDETTATGIMRTLGLMVRGDTAIRNVIHELSSSAALTDFAQRLAAVVASVEQDFTLAIHLRIQQGAAAAAKQLRKPVAEALIKVAREALVNAAKHAAPCRVSVILQMTDRGRLLLSVIDDGLGQARRHDSGHGLSSLRRLAGEYDICLRTHHGPTGGTKVTASVPLSVSGDSEQAKPASANGSARLASLGGEQR